MYMENFQMVKMDDKNSNKWHFTSCLSRTQLFSASSFSDTILIIWQGSKMKNLCLVSNCAGLEHLKYNTLFDYKLNTIANTLTTFIQQLCFHKFSRIVPSWQ